MSEDASFPFQPSRQGSTPYGQAIDCRVCHPGISPAEHQAVRLCERLYSVAQALLVELIEKHISKSLEDLGLSPAGFFRRLLPDEEGYKRFSNRFMAMLADLDAWVQKHGPVQQGFRGIYIEGCYLGSYPQLALHQILCGLGADKALAGSLAQTLRRSRAGLQVATIQSLITVFNSGCALHARLNDRLKEIKASFAGETPRAAMEQLMGLLGKFPDIADQVYQAAGVKGLRGVPPTATGEVQFTAWSPEALLIIHAGIWESQADLLGIVLGVGEMAGLIAATVALSALSAGMLSPVALGLLTTGLALVPAGARAVVTNGEYTAGKDAQRYRAASRATVDAKRNELIAAMWRVGVDAITMGAGSRVAGPLLSRGVKMVVLGGASGGASTALDPRVWTRPDTAGCILKGILMGTAGALVGASIGHAVQVSVTRAANGQPTAATVALADGRKVQCTVEGADGGTLRLRTQEGQSFPVKTDPEVLRVDQGEPAPLPTTRLVVRPAPDATGSQPSTRIVPGADPDATRSLLGTRVLPAGDPDATGSLPSTRIVPGADPDATHPLPSPKTAAPPSASGEGGLPSYSTAKRVVLLRARLLGEAGFRWASERAPLAKEFLLKYKNDPEFAGWVERQLVASGRLEDDTQTLMTQLLNGYRPGAGTARPPVTVELSHGKLRAEVPMGKADPNIREQRSYNGPPPTDITKYEERVLLLRKGDTIIARSGRTGQPRQITLGEFLGAGDATHVFAVAELREGRARVDGVGRVVRIPFAARNVLNWDSRLPMEIGRELGKRTVEQKHLYGNMPNTRAVGISDWGVEYEYVLAERVNVVETGDAFLKRGGAAVDRTRAEALGEAITDAYKAKHPDWGDPSVIFWNQARQFAWDGKRWWLLDWE